MNLRRGKRGPWISCARYPKCRGRAAWTKLDDELKKKLESDLDAHEAAHPVEPIKTIGGEVVGDEYTPQKTVGDAPELETTDEADDSDDSNV
jgi:DNA topoisomerase-1